MHIPILRVQTKSVSWAKWLRYDKARYLSEPSCLRDALRTANTRFPIPPLVPNTKGVNEPISTSNTRCWYLRFFSSSCSLNTSDVGLLWEHLELTCVTLTSKNAVTPLAQNPPALMSNLALELVTAPLKWNRSLSRGWRGGSISTLLQILSMNVVNKFRPPSCLCATPPPPPFFYKRGRGQRWIYPHICNDLVDRLRANHNASVASLWTLARSGLNPGLRAASHSAKNLRPCPSID